MNPFISIIIPVYNTEKYISECVNSILSQTYKNFEIIIVDDGSTDNSLDIVKEYQQNYDNITVLHIENSGVSAARNIGIKHAKGEFLFFVDSDDTLYDYCLSTFVTEYTDKNIDLLIGGADITYYPFTNKQKFWAEKFSSNSREENFFYYAEGRMIVAPWNKLVKKDFIIQHNLFFEEGIIIEDALWTFKLLYHSKKMKVFSTTTYLYKVRDKSIMSNITRKHADCHIKIVSLLYQYFKDINTPSSIISFETFKNQSMRYVLSLYSSQEQYHTYMYFREKLLPLYKCIFSKSISLKRVLSYSHYLLPSSIGFKLYKKILKV